MAGRYVMLWAPTLLIHGGVEACQRYLVSQSAPLVTLLASTSVPDGEQLGNDQSQVQECMFEVQRLELTRAVRLPGVVLPSIAVAGASALVMGPANWLFISCAGWGLAGAAASYFVASVASLLVSVAFVVRLEQSRPLHARCAPRLPLLGACAFLDVL